MCVTRKHPRGEDPCLNHLMVGTLHRVTFIRRGTMQSCGLTITKNEVMHH